MQSKALTGTLVSSVCFSVKSESWCLLPLWKSAWGKQVSCSHQLLVWGLQVDVNWLELFFSFSFFTQIERMLKYLSQRHLLHALGLSPGLFFGCHWSRLLFQDVSQVLSPLPQFSVMCSYNYQIYDDVKYKGHTDHLNQIKGTTAL